MRFESLIGCEMWMGFNSGDFNIGAYWRGRPLDGRGYFQWLDGFVAMLKESSPQFGSFHVTNLRSHTREALAQDRDLRWRQFADALPDVLAYENEEPANKEFSLTSHCRSGFWTTLTSSAREEQTTFSVEFRVGSTDPSDTNLILIDLSEKCFDSSSALQLFERVIQTTDPDCAVGGFVGAMREMEQPPGEVRVGWLTYVTCESPPRLPYGVRAEKVGDGFLLQVSDTPVREGNAKGIALLRAVRESLGHAGLLLFSPG